MYTKLTETGLLLSRSEVDVLISNAGNQIFDQGSNTTIHVIEGGRWLREFMNIRMQKQGNSEETNNQIKEQLPEFLKGVWFISVRFERGRFGDMYKLTDIRTLEEANAIAVLVTDLYLQKIQHNNQREVK